MDVRVDRYLGHKAHVLWDLQDMPLYLEDTRISGFF